MIIENPFSLEGKTILVTGASSGIGQETAVQCSKMGAKVIITARNENRLNETLQMLNGDGHRIILAELTSQQDIENIVSSVDALDGLVLCAGVSTALPFSFSTREKYDEIFDVNFFAPVELLRMLMKKKKLANRSSVIFVSSIGGVEAFATGNCIYGASKAAINSTMKYCAREFAPKGIRVNSVNPAMVNTRLLKDNAVSEEQHKKDMEKYPLKRYGEPVDIAMGIIYLLSDASSWVTGQSLIIDGGFLLVR